MPVRPSRTLTAHEASQHTASNCLQGAALLCLWPLPLGQASEATYARWREWLVPAHLAAQHWIGLHFSLPSELQQALVSWRSDLSGRVGKGDPPA